MHLRSIPDAEPIFGALPDFAGFYMETNEGWRTGCFVSLKCLVDPAGGLADLSTMRQRFHDARERIERAANRLYDVIGCPVVVTPATLDA